MPSVILKKMLSGEISLMELDGWLGDKEVTAPDLLGSSKADFIDLFLELVRSHAESVLQPNAKEIQTKKKNISIKTVASADRTIRQEDESGNIATRKYVPLEVSAEPEDNVRELIRKMNTVHKAGTSKNPPHINKDCLHFSTSTPCKLKEESSSSCWITIDETTVHSKLSVQNKDSDDTTSPRDNPIQSRSKNRPLLIFGDFIPSTKPSKAKKNKTRLSNSFESDENENAKLDLSNPHMFPEIGEQSKRHYFKDKVAQNTPETVKIKFLDVIGPNTLEDYLSPIQPLEETNELDNWVTPDQNKVTSKEVLNKLVHIYKTLSLNNLVPSITSDLYSFILILLSKQKKEQLEKITTNLHDSNSYEDILKIIHNSAYFASRVLWHHKKYLNFILERNTLKMLSEKKIICDFSPDLVSYVSNIYFYQGGADNRDNESGVSANTHGIVCWNNETDNLANFPSTISFQAFKKQRDMFYDIYRSYPAISEQNTAVRGSSLHSRIRSLLATAVSPANHAHLARLFVAHMTSECMTKPCLTQARMKKLQRRFTVASGEENNYLLPRFGSREIFYKEFLTLAETESFRSHVKDILIYEISRLDGSFIINGDTDGQEKGCIDVTDKFVKLTKTLRLLSKFLSYLSTLPYCQVPVDFAMKTGAAADYGVRHITYTMPKETIYERELDVRNHSQPPIDLKGMLKTAVRNGRLSVTLPWIVQYLSIMDYTGLRTVYNVDLIKELFKVLINILTPESDINTDVRFYLITMLSWLFDLPHFPQTVFYTDLDMPRELKPYGNKDSIDSMNLIDQVKVIELCPFLKRFQTLFTCPPSQAAGLVGTVKHVRPITIAPNPEDMQKIKSHELQISLEQELLKSQPLATQRVIEMVVERVTFRGVHEFREALASSIESSKIAAIKLVNSHRTEEDLLVRLKAMFEVQLADVKSQCMEIVELSFKERTLPAIEALISNGARDQLAIVAFRETKSRLLKWLGEHLNSTDVLCKDIEGLMKKIQRIGPSVPLPQENDVKSNLSDTTLGLDPDQFDKINISPSTVFFELKGSMCELMSSEELSLDLNKNLELASLACKDANIMMRPPVKMTIFQQSLDLTIIYLTYLPDAVNEELLNKIGEVWNICCPNRKHTSTAEEELDSHSDLFEQSDMETSLGDDKPIITVTPAATSNISINSQLNDLNKRYEQDMLDCFTRILCVRNIRMLNDKAPNNRKTWMKMAEFLVYLMRNKYLSENQLTEVFLQILQNEWPQPCFDNISQCLHMVTQLMVEPISPQLTLLMEFLEDFTKDIDNLY